VTSLRVTSETFQDIIFIMLKIRRFPLDTRRENVAVLASSCTALRPEAFQAFKRLEISGVGHTIIASLDITDNLSLVAEDEIGLTEPAFRRMGLTEGAVVSISPARRPQSLSAVRLKVDGVTLSKEQIESIIQDIAAYRYSDMELAAFLVACAGFLTTDELLTLTTSMAQAGARLKWPGSMTVDKHCIGGVPGNRTSMIVVPIVAAHGLKIPKTSSRAITSPAGTADTMEVLAEVDLPIDEMQRIVAEYNGCMVWGGRVNLSPVDDILISVERPLSLDTKEQMVASIISKKIAAGSTHLLIDIPLGPTSKVRDSVEAMRLRKLFEYISDQVGIHTEVIVTDGSQPVGRGVGPVLEARDVLAVLENDLNAPADLRERALLLAGRVLENDPQIRGGAGYARAKELLESGAALNTMNRIIDAQGRRKSAPKLGDYYADIHAQADGRVVLIDCQQISTLARLAGAPLSPGSGLDLFKRVGDQVQAGEPLFRIHSAEPSDFNFAVSTAEETSGFVIGALGVGR